MALVSGSAGLQGLDCRSCGKAGLEAYSSPIVRIQSPSSNKTNILYKCKASFKIQLMHRTIIKDLLTSRTYCITVLYVCTGIQENNCFVKMFQYFSEQYVKQLWSEVQTMILLCRSCEIVQIFSFACVSFPLRFYENVNLQIVSQTAFWVFIICLWPPCFYTYVTEYCAIC